MDNLTFEDLDRYLLDHHGKIIHQVWFNNINPNKRTSRKLFESLQKYRDSWLIKNPDWLYICWDVDKSYTLMKTHYPEHVEMYKRYTYNIQRCDAVRYFFLHRYGGIYADMDYFCNRPMTEAFINFTNDLYLVQTPNTIGDTIRVSNSFMYAQPNHPFWRTLFMELEKCQKAPYYWGKHIIIMYTTGPAILNRLFHRYRFRYKLEHLPHELFHPYGLNTDIMLLNRPEVYAIHLGKGSWESDDSKWIIFLYKEHKIILFILLALIVPFIISVYVLKK